MYLNVLFPPNCVNFFSKKFIFGNPNSFNVQLSIIKVIFLSVGKMIFKLFMLFNIFVILNLSKMYDLNKNKNKML